MKNSRHSVAARARFHLGPGTVLAALAVGVTLFVYGNRFPGASGSTPMELQADAQGRLHQVPISALQHRTPPPPLWKPEVGLLTSHNSQLLLSDAQRAALTHLNVQWLQLKQQALQQMASAASDTGTALQRASSSHSRISMLQITGGLSGYSELSRRYNRLRGSFWMQAVALLTPSQQRQVSNLQEETR